MEKAIFIRDISLLNEMSLNSIDRIYFGNDTCEHQIPSVEEVKEILNLCKKKGLNFTLVTPNVTKFGLNKLEKIMGILPSDTEVVINDYGTLRLIQDKGYSFTKILGRLLVNVKRDPRVSKLNDYLDYFQTSNLNSQAFQSFLLSNDILRIELDNIIQGYNFRLCSGLSTSVYFPYVYIATTRKCFATHIKNFVSSKSNKVINPCNFECKGKEYKAKMRGFGVSVILKGNTTYYYNMDFINKEDYRCNREVFIPYPPFL